MIHFESASRDTAVAEWEKGLFRDRWETVTAVDPYDNPNFDHRSINRVLPVPRRRRIAGALVREARALVRPPVTAASGPH